MILHGKTEQGMYSLVTLIFYNQGWFSYYLTKDGVAINIVDEKNMGDAQFVKDPNGKCYVVGNLRKNEYEQ